MKCLYEILVPTRFNSGKAVPVAYHRQWDALVRKISGGMTILKAAKGNWVSPDGTLFAEKMIPVRIFCSSRQISKISDLTAAHYRQEAVMFYEVSHKVTIRRYQKAPEPTFRCGVVKSSEIAKSDGMRLDAHNYI